ncbi:hypothetical protein [Stenotrophomonas sp. S39]|uniref:hypothetical protein n=1 Tax=Stenotrophomonas sp. S39 TaxID=2767451 RepID=UPI00190D15EC|nr:hypothetical protein [Stenotrophomonas sp. S39]MBK0054531.1 hypothetical protein [Stenotrophomonas sp. S39]
MSDTFRWTRANTPVERVSYESWADISLDGLDELASARVNLLTKAVKAYIDGEPHDPSLEQFGVYRATVLRAFRRCTGLDSFGRAVGWQGLLPHRRLSTPERHAPLVRSGRMAQGGLTGALGSVLSRYPAVRAGLDDFLIGCAMRKVGYEAAICAASVHGKFLELCKDAGIPGSSWPFTTKYQGRESIRRYCNKFINENYDQIVSTQYGSKARARANTSTGHQGRLACTRPFDIVELDEHKCGFIGAIGVPSPEGLRWLPMERITIVLVVERFFKVVLGYAVVLRREANSGDVLDALNAAVGGGAPSCDVDGLSRSSVAKLPRELSETFEWCGFDALLLDNALAHLSHDVIERAKKIVGCDVNFGPKARFERRSLVENVFGQLEKRGFRRIPLTTGVSPVDPQRQSPEKAAGQARIPLEGLLRFVDDVISEYNTHQGKSNYGDSPMGRLEAGCDDQDGMGFMFPVLPPLPAHLAGLNESVYSVSVRGNKKTGRRPYFTFKKESYTGFELSKNFDLIGKRVRLHVVRKDIRSIEVFDYYSGRFIDTCKVMGGWAKHEHSLDARSHINSLIASGQLRVEYGESAVAKFNEVVLIACETATKASKPGKRLLSTFAATSELAGTAPRKSAFSGELGLEGDLKASRPREDELVESDDVERMAPDEYLDYKFTSVLGFENDGD